jgi:hypothetical protein
MGLDGGVMEGYKKSKGTAWNHRKPHEIIRGSSTIVTEEYKKSKGSEWSHRKLD